VHCCIFEVLFHNQNFKKMNAEFVKNQNIADVIAEECAGFNAWYDGPSSFESGDGYYIVRDGNTDGTPSRDLVYRNPNGEVHGWLSLTEEQERILLA
jgi:hypothetical protein